MAPPKENIIVVMKIVHATLEDSVKNIVYVPNNYVKLEEKAVNVRVNV